MSSPTASPGVRAQPSGERGAGSTSRPSAMRQRSDARGALRAPGRVGSEPTPEIRAGLRKSVRLCVRLTPNQGRGGGGRAPGAARVPLRRGGDGDERSGGGEARRRRLPRALLGLKRSRTLRERAGGSRVARPGPCAEKLSWRIEWKKTSEATRAAASEWNPGRKKGIETEPRRASLRRRSSLFASLRSAMKTWGGWGEGEGKRENCGKLAYSNTLRRGTLLNEI